MKIPLRNLPGDNDLRFFTEANNPVQIISAKRCQTKSEVTRSVILNQWLVFHVHNLSDSKFGVLMHVKVLTQGRRALTHKLPKYKNKTKTKKISFMFFFLRGWKLQYRGRFTLWSHKKRGALLCRTVLKIDWSCQFCISAFYASPVISLPSSFSGEIPWLSVFMCLTHAQNFLVHPEFLL